LPKDESSRDETFKSAPEAGSSTHNPYHEHEHDLADKDTTETPSTSDGAPASKSALIWVQLALPMSQAEFMKKEHSFINAIAAAAGVNVSKHDILVKTIKEGLGCNSLKPYSKQAKLTTEKMHKNKAQQDEEH
jgi:hypothetical protein